MSSSRVAGIQQKIAQSENQINILKKQLSILKASSSKTAIEKEEKKLKSENDCLKKQINDLVARLSMLEASNGLVQVPLPSGGKPVAAKKEVSHLSQSPSEQVPHKIKSNEMKEIPQAPKQTKKEKKGEKKETPKAAKKDGDGGGDTVDVSRLDFRIGQIIDVKLHPDADSLYVETVDVGEERPRTILSGLVKHVPINEMQGRRAVFMCNLKPVKMRGIFSEGMIMCASTEEGIQIIEVPAAAVPGDLVSVEGYPRTPDAQLNPKKKIFEKIKPDLRIDDQGFATYKSAKWVIEGKGYPKAPSFVNAQIS